MSEESQGQDKDKYGGCQYGHTTRDYTSSVQRRMWLVSAGLGALILFMLPVSFGMISDVETRIRRHRERMESQIESNRSTISQLKELNGRLEERLKSIDESLDEIKTEIRGDRYPGGEVR